VHFPLKMGRERTGYVNVDQLMREVTLEQVAAYYGAELPELKRIGKEVRTKCFLACGRTEETGDRALAIQVDHPAKIWRCHHYGCGRGGNLVSLCDFLKPGQNAEGKPRGGRFKEILADLQAIASGEVREVLERPAAKKRPPEVKPVENVPLVRSENERARELTNLDEKFVVDVATMNPKAAAYFRRRPFLTPEVCRRWRMGYLARDTGGDKRGGTMRGKIVYPMLSAEGEVLTWFGRDPAYEEKHGQWEQAGRTGREPEKFHFVKGFRRGIELFGQHRLGEEAFREQAASLGLVVVEGPNDVIRLDCLGVPAVGLCSNTVTREQVEKLARHARELCGGRVTLMFDCDPEGENGAKQALWELAQVCRPTLAWSREMHGGKFAGKQPESLSEEEWTTIRAGV